MRFFASLRSEEPGPALRDDLAEGNLKLLVGQ
jgi:hypothetical protein